MNKKLLLVAGVSSVLLLAGCASGPDEETTSQLSSLTTQVDELSKEVAALKANQSDADAKAAEAAAAAAAAQDEADRANERIDNIAQSYTK